MIYIYIKDQEKVTITNSQWNANANQNEIAFQPILMITINTSRKQKVLEGMRGRWKAWALMVALENDVGTVETLWLFINRLKLD